MGETGQFSMDETGRRRSQPSMKNVVRETCVSGQTWFLGEFAMENMGELLIYVDLRKIWWCSVSLLEGIWNLREFADDSVDFSRLEIH